LSCQARQSIVDNNGYWPDSLNNHEAVRASIRFNDCVVSFSGTANACGSHVYAQKVYDFADMHVGYSFANMLTVRQGSIVMDSSLLNVVHEQVGGGAEPIATPSAVDG
jgi:hypothetical protein